MKTSTLNIVEKLREQYPEANGIYPRKLIESVCANMGYLPRDYYPLLKYPKVKRGVYNLTALAPQQPQHKEQAQVSSNVQSITNTSDAAYVAVDDSFIPWGHYSDVKKIVKSSLFYPIYISGLSGNGKTMMVEQACANLSRECIRVQITPETDEDDLIGGFRLLDGETVFSKGPVIRAMETGAILLIDEIDRATNKIMCLQGILEGKPVMIKKTGEIVRPRKGFNVIATANTKGKGSDDGRFSAASIIDEAFLERFTITMEQPYPTQATELRILAKHADKNGVQDDEFLERLSAWGDIIRKTFYDDGVDEVVSTRRLCHIVQTFAIFNNRTKAIQLCINRFDEDTKEAFMDLYTKLDGTVAESTETTEGNEVYANTL